jgi:hypothetical protein
MSDQLKLAANRIRFEHDPFGRLILIGDDATRLVDVVPIRAFPVSDPDHQISICDADGHEVFFIWDLADVMPDVRKVLEEEMARREFIPVIEQIFSATHEEPSQWSVRTDRGETSFQVNNEDDVRRIEPVQASILDSHGTRYLIPDIRKLDSASRRIIDRYL